MNPDPSRQAPEGRSHQLEARLRRDRWAARLALTHGLFYFTTGVWPILHLPSFLWVTGPKTDLWLVQTVGAVLAAIGLALWKSGRSRAVTAEIKLLGGGVAAVLATCDIVFVMKDVILPIYLLDAAAEVALVTAWIACSTWKRSLPRS